MTTTVQVTACPQADVAITFLDNIRSPENDVAAVDADPENGVEAQEARTAYALTPSVVRLAAGESAIYHVTSLRTIVVSEVPGEPAATTETTAAAEEA